MMSKISSNISAKNLHFHSKSLIRKGLNFFITYVINYACHTLKVLLGIRRNLLLAPSDTFCDQGILQKENHYNNTSLSSSFK